MPLWSACREPHRRSLGCTPLTPHPLSVHTREAEAVTCTAAVFTKESQRLMVESFNVCLMCWSMAKITCCQAEQSALQGVTPEAQPSRRRCRCHRFHQAPAPSHQMHELGTQPTAPDDSYNHRRAHESNKGLATMIRRRTAACRFSHVTRQVPCHTEELPGLAFD